MADFELVDDLGDGTVSVRRKRDGFTQAIPKTTAQNLANEGFLELPGQGIAGPSAPAPAVPQPAPTPQAAAPAPAPLSSTIGLEVPAQAPAGGGVARPTTPDRTGSGRMQAFGALQQAGVDSGQALDALAATGQPGASGAEEDEGGVDPSSLVMAREQAPQQPVGPQYATATQTSTSTTKALGVEEDIELMDDAAERQAEALRDQAEAQEAYSTKVAAQHEAEAEAREEFAVRHAERQARVSQEVDERMGEIEQLQTEFQKAAEEGRGSYWSRQDTPTKISAALSVMFGAVSEAYGGRNTGLEIINQTIERDRQSRRDAQADRQQAIRGKYDLVQATRTVAKDETEAELITLDTQLGAIQSKIREAAAERDTEQAYAIADQAIAEFDQQRAAVQAKLRPQVTTNVVKKQIPIASPQQTAAEMPSGKIVNPTLWNNLRDLDKQKARDTAAAYRDFIAASDRMIELREKYKTEAFDTEAASEYQQTQNLQVGAMGQLMESGVLNEGEAERYKKALGGGLGPKLSDAQRLVTAGQVDPTLNLVRGMRTTVQNKAARVGRDKWGIEISTGAAPSSFKPGI